MQSACAVLYCHLCHLWLYHISQRYPTKATTFGEKLLNTKLFWCSIQILSETFLILRRIGRNIVINVLRFLSKVPASLFRLLWHSIFFDRFKKIFKYWTALILLTWIIWWAPNNASKWQMVFNSAFKGLMKIRRVVVELFHVDGRTDRHDEANSSFLQFCESA
jgi:hypothetical protein